MFSNIKHKIYRPFVETAHTEEGHFYKTESGKTYPSITTVLKVLDTKEWYPFWVAKVARDEEITEAQAEIRCKEIGGNSMEMGNIVHKLAEEYLSNATVNKPSSKIEEIDPMDLFVPLSEHLTEHVDNVHGLEVPIYSDDLQLAGTADCIGEYDGVLSIVDFKNSRKPKTKSQCKSKDYFIQLCAYAKMWEFCTGQKIEQGVILVISWDGKVKPFKVNLSEYEADLYKKLVLVEQKQALNSI
jgi:genome maintenance exonuclease 1